jgi:hypothetical protein
LKRREEKEEDHSMIPRRKIEKRLLSEQRDFATTKRVLRQHTSPSPGSTS